MTNEEEIDIKLKMLAEAVQHAVSLIKEKNGQKSIPELDLMNKINAIRYRERDNSKEKCELSDNREHDGQGVSYWGPWYSPSSDK